MAVVSQRDHNQPGSVRQVRIEAAHRVFERMLGDTARGRLDHSRKRIGQCHVRTRLQVGTVGNGTRQVNGEQTHALERKGVAHRCGHAGEISFRSMEEGIESLECRQLRRYRQHQLGIDDRQHRKEFVAAETHFMAGFVMGNDRPRVSFGSGTRRRRNRDDRQRPRRFFASFDIIPVITFVGRSQCDGFSRIDRAAAAQADHEVAPLGAAQRSRLAHMAQQRIGQHLVKHDALRTVIFFQQLHHPVQVAVFFDGLPRCRDDQSFLARQFRRSQFIQFAGAEKHPCRNVKIEFFHLF